MNRVDLDGLDGVLGGAPATNAATPVPVVPRATPARRMTVMVAPPPDLRRPPEGPDWLKEPSGVVAQERSIPRHVAETRIPPRRASTPAEPLRAQRPAAEDPESTGRDLRVRRPREKPPAQPNVPTDQTPPTAADAPRAASVSPVLLPARPAPAPAASTPAVPPSPAPLPPPPAVAIGNVFTPRPVPFQGPRQTPPPMRAVSATRPKPKARASRRWGRRALAALAFSGVAFGIATMLPPSHPAVEVAAPSPKRAPPVEAQTQNVPPPVEPPPPMVREAPPEPVIELAHALPPAVPVPLPSPLEETAGLTFPANFPFGLADPEIVDRAAVKAFVEQVRRGCDGRDIELVGHTCSSGNFTSNWALGKARALRVGRLLVAAGVPSARLRYGTDAGAEPLVSNDSPEGRRANRRVTARCSSPTPSQER